jgi:hypothetical protein
MKVSDVLDIINTIDKFYDKWANNEELTDESIEDLVHIALDYKTELLKKEVK